MNRIDTPAAAADLIPFAALSGQDYTALDLPLPAPAAARKPAPTRHTSFVAVVALVAAAAPAFAGIGPHGVKANGAQLSGGGLDGARLATLESVRVVAVTLPEKRR